MRRLILALLAALALTTPARLSAQLFTWDYLCSLGDASACVNFSLSLQYDPFQQSFAGYHFAEGVTRATFAVQNLQGSQPWLPGSGPWQFIGFNFAGLQTTWAAPGPGVNPYFWWDVSLGVPSVGSLGGKATLFADRPVDEVPTGGRWAGWEVFAERGAALNGGLYSGDFFAHTPNPVGGFYGCDIPTEFSVGSSGFHGGCGTTFYVSMMMPGQWTMTENTSVSWLGRIVSDGTAVGCTVGIDCVQVSVPEPSGALLVATGLLGMAYVRRRRAT